MILDSQEDEVQAVNKWLSDCKSEGMRPHEIGVFVRSAGQLDRAVAAAKDAGLPFKILDENVETTSGYTAISTVHLTHACLPRPGRTSTRHPPGR